MNFLMFFYCFYLNSTMFKTLSSNFLQEKPDEETSEAAGVGEKMAEAAGDLVHKNDPLTKSAGKLSLS